MRGDKTKEERFIETDMEDTIMEKPIPFRVGKRRFFLYYPSLGKMFLIGRLMRTIGIDAFSSSQRLKSTTRIEVEEYRDTVCRLLAYSVLRTRQEIQNEDRVKEAQDYFRKNLTEEDSVKLLSAIFGMWDVSRFIKYYGLNREAAVRARVMRAKNKDGGGISFGGKSLYGSMIDTLCDRYGWTMDYVIWGISYQNIQMLLSDMQTHVYLSKDEARRARLSDDGEIIDADDPRNRERIKQLFK